MNKFLHKFKAHLDGTLDLRPVLVQKDRSRLETCSTMESGLSCALSHIGTYEIIIIQNSEQWLVGHDWVSCRRRGERDEEAEEVINARVLLHAEQQDSPRTRVIGALLIIAVLPYSIPWRTYSLFVFPYIYIYILFFPYVSDDFWCTLCVSCLLLPGFPIVLSLDSLRRLFMHEYCKRLAAGSLCRLRKCVSSSHLKALEVRCCFAPPFCPPRPAAIRQRRFWMPGCSLNLQTCSAFWDKHYHPSTQFVMSISNLFVLAGNVSLIFA